MAAEASSHLEALVSSRDQQAKEQHAVIITWINQFMEVNGGIMEALKEERKALLEQQDQEPEPEGSPYMESDSGAFDAAD
jgi:transcription initiation factor IIE alpha subunit